jgi:hypothetical protein
MRSSFAGAGSTADTIFVCGTELSNGIPRKKENKDMHK